MIWGQYFGIRVSQQKLTFYELSLVIVKNSFLGVCLWLCFYFTGSDIIQTRLHENDINSDDMHRISVDTDWTDGLTSRY